MIEIAEGAGHKVFRSGGKVIKIPKGGCNFVNGSRVQECIDYARERFGRFIPDTTVSLDGGTYKIEQLYIKGTHISTKNIRGVIAELNELLWLHSRSLSERGIGLDFVGLEGAIKATLYQLQKYRGTVIDICLISPLLSMLSNRGILFQKIFENWKQGSIPELANIMIDEHGNIFVIDLSLTENHCGASIISRTRARVIEIYNRYYLRKYFLIVY